MWASVTGNETNQGEDPTDASDGLGVHRGRCCRDRVVGCPTKRRGHVKPRTKRVLLAAAGVSGVVMLGAALTDGQDATSVTQPSAPVPTASATSAPPGVVVTNVVDGDTFDVGATRYRVIGIDTEDPADAAATAYAEKLLNAGPVRLEVDPSQPKTDRYGRALVHVFLADGSNFGQLMIGQGWAVEYTVGRPHRFQVLYRNTQRAAQKPDGPASGPSMEPAGSVYYRSCAEARQVGAAPLHKGAAGYRSGLDGDGDGTACEG